MKNTEVISGFLSNSRGTGNFFGGVVFKTENLFFDDSILYSYGYHYPLCIKLADNKYIINKSGYSMTTSKHTGHLLREIGITANLKEVEKNRGNYPNIILMTTEQIKSFIDYHKSRNLNLNNATSNDLALMELEKEDNSFITEKGCDEFGRSARYS